jgi:hypothetical protein
VFDARVGLEERVNLEMASAGKGKRYAAFNCPYATGRGRRSRENGIAY